jgi:hypothetical protein
VIFAVVGGAEEMLFHDTRLAVLDPAKSIRSVQAVSDQSRS